MHTRTAKPFIPLLPVLCAAVIWFPAMAQIEDIPPETATSTPQAVLPELNVSVSVIFPAGAYRTALKPNDQFAIRIEAPGMGITDVQINYDELGIGLEPLGNSETGIFISRTRWLPFRPEGLKQYTVSFRDALGNQHSITKTVLVDTSPPSGSLVSTFTKTQGTISAHVAGTINGTGTLGRISNLSLYGVVDDIRVPGEQVDTSALDIDRPFSLDLSIPVIDESWSTIGYSLSIEDGAGNKAHIHTDPTPVASIRGKALINHALSGSIVMPREYEDGGIPGGVDIPYTLINTLPENDYFAVVFFEGLRGCPTTTYQINAYQVGGMWGYDIRGRNAPYSFAYSTQAGGCMQPFHIDPAKEGDWKWGALNNATTSPAVASPDGIPAFAICDDEAVCDAIAPSVATSPEPEHASSTSSILFLPGIKGSKLYRNNPLCLIPSLGCDMPLWLPLADIATPELFLNDQGKSKKQIYAKEGDILQNAFGYSFYDAFVDDLEHTDSADTYGPGWKWKSIAYDWRLSLPDIISTGTKYTDRIYYDQATNEPYIEKSLRELASSSPTGKVTIVAHSNGGLVAKQLMQKLGTESSELIDNVILVGVPQSGAPRALGAFLYGDSEGIPGTGRFPNLLMSPAHAREFALTSPMAYHLLPSARYMEPQNPSYPLVKFSGDTLLAPERAVYGDTIDTANELHSYLLAEYGGRTMPDTGDLSRPNIARATMLQYAEGLHEQLDAWTAPNGIEVYQVGGYGIDTISGIEMYEIPTKVGGVKPAYRPLFMQDGDGTVPILSSLMMNSAGVRVDMGSSGHQYSHGDMFEMPAVREIIRSVLEGTFGAQRITADTSASHKRISFFLHGDAVLSVINASGKETSVGGSLPTKQEIPHSEVGTFGVVRYVTVPAGQTYATKLSGISDTTVTFEMQDRDGAFVTASSTVADIETTGATTARIEVNEGIEHATPFTVDEDGDGNTDYTVETKIGEVVFPSGVKEIGVQTSIVEKIVRTVVAKTPLAPLGFLASNKIVASTSEMIVGAVVPTETSEVRITQQIPLEEEIEIEAVRAEEILIEKERTLLSRIIEFVSKIFKAIFVDSGLLPNENPIQPRHQETKRA